ncbi:hypothetical protein Bbelb_353200 [Branchiostoma belcheri]|nr:hypothetical protein Bbelb_353200 [Branchiostoma belcheri]
MLLFTELGFIVTIILKDSLSPMPQTKQEHREETEEALQACSRPRQKYVFIAPHKVGASTSCTIFQRYAISRKIPMMLPIQGVVLSWGVSPTEEEYIHTPDEQYHALMNHFTYNKTWLRSKFPADTAYISIVRDPSEQLRSAMNYYYLPELLKIKSENPLKTFLKNPWRYKNRSEVNFAHCNVTWDPSRNFMAFDLGYPTEGVEDKQPDGQPNNSEKTQAMCSNEPERALRYVNELEADFTLVMLLDHLDESYVLLKRLMCWELQDVLYVTKNNRSYSFKEYVPSDKEIAMLRRWKAVDYLLHDTFNKSLWNKIAAQGPGFFEEVQHFKKINKLVNTHCAEWKDGETNLTVETSKWNSFNLTVEASRWNSQFEVDAEFCRVLNAKKMAKQDQNLTFRLASHEDYDAVIRMSYDIYGDTDYLPAFFHSFIDDPNTRVSLRRWGTSALVIATITEGGLAYVSTSGRVAPAWRSRDIIRKVVRYQDEWIRQNRPTARYKRPYVEYKGGPNLWWRQDPAQLAQLDKTGLPDVVPLQGADDDFCTAVQKWLPAGACGGYDGKPVILVDWDPYTLCPANLHLLQAEKQNLHVETQRGSKFESL